MVFSIFVRRQVISYSDGFFPYQMLFQIFTKANFWKTILSQVRYVFVLLSIVQTPIRSFFLFQELGSHHSYNALNLC